MRFSSSTSLPLGSQSASLQPSQYVAPPAQDAMGVPPQEYPYNPGSGSATMQQQQLPFPPSVSSTSSISSSVAPFPGRADSALSAVPPAPPTYADPSPPLTTPLPPPQPPPPPPADSSTLASTPSSTPSDSAATPAEASRLPADPKKIVDVGWRSKLYKTPKWVRVAAGIIAFGVFLYIASSLLSTTVNIPSFPPAKCDCNCQCDGDKQSRSREDRWYPTGAPPRPTPIPKALGQPTRTPAPPVATPLPTGASTSTGRLRPVVSLQQSGGNTAESPVISPGERQASAGDARDTGENSLESMHASVLRSLETMRRSNAGEAGEHRRQRKTERETERGAAGAGTALPSFSNSFSESVVQAYPGHSTYSMLSG